MALFDHFDVASLEDDDLCLSGHSDGALFDFIDMDEGGLFESLQFDALEIEAHGAIQEEMEVADFPRSRVEAEGVDLGAVEFDPPPQQLRKQRKLNKHHRRASGSDVSALSVQSTSTQDPQAVCWDQLQKLADSMRRSEVTRRHVALQRDALPAEQRRALRAATQLLHRQTMRLVQRRQRERLRDQKRRREEEHLFTGMALFFENGSFTRGLEQSRRRIGLYASQVNHGTL